MERAIGERALFKRAADSSPYAVFGETTLFSIGGCERNGMNFDEAFCKKGYPAVFRLIYIYIYTGVLPKEG